MVGRLLEVSAPTTEVSAVDESLDERQTLADVVSTLLARLAVEARLSERTVSDDITDLEVLD